MREMVKNEFYIILYYNRRLLLALVLNIVITLYCNISHVNIYVSHGSSVPDRNEI